MTVCETYLKQKTYLISLQQYKRYHSILMTKYYRNFLIGISYCVNDFSSKIKIYTWNKLLHQCANIQRKSQTHYMVMPYGAQSLKCERTQKHFPPTQCMQIFFKTLNFIKRNFHQFKCLINVSKHRSPMVSILTYFNQRIETHYKW